MYVYLFLMLSLNTQHDCKLTREGAVLRSQDLKQVTNPMDRITGTRLAQKIPDIFWDPSIHDNGNEVRMKFKIELNYDTTPPYAYMTKKGAILHTLQGADLCSCLSPHCSGLSAQDRMLCFRFGVLTLRRLMSYIYGAPILDVSRSHTTTQHSRQDSSGRVICSSQRPLPDNTRHSQQTNIHAPGGIQTQDLSR